ncbi:DUF4123 domain-containing protein [Salmonella enterica]|uniref:DUF4123 domain-containing protein n=1 Tax=Salmonella enterica TaxID=28901 RepID=A0A3J8T8G4_SALER|nr:DUF4123 domain-containing protein [Salmonella enterica]EAU5130898.1 DUF4123 domain-containing protein [Salmonella enterica subsp. enterica serovar Oranienburg]ECD9477132.1 DUF4123 domain-containing protein [Salmonella enterica subsp. houtenae]EAO3204397.1 DUF4123 domain-containing protein [Salmonella enterica]EAX0785464.1 DUF4123 domain-containing protein [Salmonella enterica]
MVHQQWQNLGLPAPAHLYVLAEATPENKLLPQMEFHQVSHRALWWLDGQPELAFYAPYLIDMAGSLAFSQWFDKHSNEMAFTVLDSTLAFSPLWQHLRHFTKFADIHENRYYFLRIGNAAMLHLYVSSITDRPDCVSRLFAGGQISGFLFQNHATDLLMYCHPLFKNGTFSKGREEGCLLWHDLMEDLLFRRDA